MLLQDGCLGDRNVRVVHEVDVVGQDASDDGVLVRNDDHLDAVDRGAAEDEEGIGLHDRAIARLVAYDGEWPGADVLLAIRSERIRFELLSIVQIGTAAVLAWTLFWTLERPVQVHWRPAVVYGILITGLLATAGAFSAQAWAQHYTTSTRTALIYMLEPVVAAITSFLLAGEGLSARAAAGAALILAGVLLVELKPLNPRLHP